MAADGGSHHTGSWNLATPLLCRSSGVRQPSAPSMAHLAWITSISRYLQHPPQSHISTSAGKPCHICVLLDNSQKTPARSQETMLHSSMPYPVSIWEL